MTVTSPKGFLATGLACGIKQSGALDLALVANKTLEPVACAGVFTTNRAAAAPVKISRDHLSIAQMATGVLINSGNANAATGKAGYDGAMSSLNGLAGQLGVEPTNLLVCSTGLIGIPLDFTTITKALPSLVDRLGDDQASGEAAARAIMTTDTFPKQVAIKEGPITLGGMAKGAAMLEPSMATMLCVLTVDARIDPGILQDCLSRAVDESFNKIIVDGAMSTNDTVLVFANGNSGVTSSQAQVLEMLTRACQELSGMMLADAEGGSKTASITISRASTKLDAIAGARKVASSLLVKCSLHGGDPYWGRIVSELGSTVGDFDLEQVTVSYGDYCVCRGGVGVAHDTESLIGYMQGSHVDIYVDLGVGSESETLRFCDISAAYIEENMRTS